jgi:plastocyanin
MAQLMHEGPAAETSQMASVLGETEQDNRDLPPVAIASSAAAVPQADADASMSMMSHSQPVRRLRPATVKHAAEELHGCLAVDGNHPTLKLFGSHKVYNLEPRFGLEAQHPLIFANNVNALVAVTGKSDRSSSQPIFVVDSIDKLAPTCDEHVSLARLLRAKRTPQADKTNTGNITAASSSGSGATVTMGDMTFEPVQVQITAGQQVTWKNTSPVVHNVVADPAQALIAADVHLPRGAKPFGSPLTFSRRFDLPGIYHYVCTLHEGNGMKGVVVVRPATSVNMASARNTTHSEGK